MSKLNSLQWEEGHYWGNTEIFHECENSSESRSPIILFILVIHVHVYQFTTFLQTNGKENVFQNFPFCLLKKKLTPKSFLFVFSKCMASVHSAFSFTKVSGCEVPAFLIKVILKEATSEATVLKTPYQLKDWLILCLLQLTTRIKWLSN